MLTCSLTRATCAAPNQPDSIADYTVEVYEKTTYLRLSRNLYISAVRNSLMERKSDFADTTSEDSQRTDSITLINDSYKKQ